MTNTKNIIEVTLHIFSGEPNPKWILTEMQIDELKRKLGLQLPLDRPKLIPTGYGGFIVRNLSKVSMIPDKVHVYDGVLAITDNGIANYYKDIGKTEEWLFNQACGLGYGDAIEERRGYTHK